MLVKGGPGVIWRFDYYQICKSRMPPPLITVPYRVYWYIVAAFWYQGIDRLITAYRTSQKMCTWGALCIVFCCGLAPVDYIQVSQHYSVILRPSCDYPTPVKTSMNDMDKYIEWIIRKWLYNQNQIVQRKPIYAYSVHYRWLRGRLQYL